MSRIPRKDSNAYMRDWRERNKATWRPYATRKMQEHRARLNGTEKGVSELTYGNT